MKKTTLNQEQAIKSTPRVRNKKIFFANVLVIVLIVSVGFVMLKNFDTINEKKEELEYLRHIEETLRIGNEELNAKLKMEVDYEYIEKIAKEKGYRKPNSIIFHIHSD